MRGVELLVAPPIRVEDWDAFEVPGGYEAEIVMGELVVTPGPELSHGRAQSRLTIAFATFVPAGYESISGPEWRLDVGGLVAMAPQPDLMVVRTDLQGKAVLSAPLLVVEILSPSDFSHRLANGMTRREGKLADYAANGLQDYLEVDLTAATATAIRYELQVGTLVEVDRAVGSELLRAGRPFAFEFRPADLVS